MCIAVVEELFGANVAKVFASLQREPSGLPPIIVRLKGQINLGQIRKSLTVLIQHRLVEFRMDARNRAEYQVNEATIRFYLMAPKCCMYAKRLFGAAAELICEELLCEGQLSCSDTIRRIHKRYDHLSVDELKKVFYDLSATQFVIRLPPLDSKGKITPSFSLEYSPFEMPNKILDGEENAAKVKLEPGTSRKRKAPFDETSQDSDAQIYWTINWERFGIYIRDEMVTEFLVPQDSTDKTAFLFRQTVRALLKANETKSAGMNVSSSAPISLFQMIQIIKDNDCGIERTDLEFALDSLSNETRGVLRKTGESNGGIYMIDFAKAFTLISQGHVESLIREQLDVKGIRIFRLLQNRGYLDEDQVEKQSMLSNKDVRELVYSMLEMGYLNVQVLGKTADFAPARTFYLYYVSLPKTVRCVVEDIAKMLRNLILRRAHETREHKQLAEKNLKKESIIEGIKLDDTLDEESRKAQIEEVEEMYMPPADREKLAAHKLALGKLIAAESHAADALFACRLFLDYHV
ncbi:hypothetical protein WR25_27137 [Diploscapter pachys]|uniref:DNA-directed RNA polymerase III subunit RPC3 n=1 Tax=Diploscapter pachys TaxID=2018661 RepID=A0A2A2KUG0_9BILA|nr:hypothetical protein WR25_27137 [Diploscapter pachys]